MNMDKGKMTEFPKKIRNQTKQKSNHLWNNVGQNIHYRSYFCSPNTFVAEKKLIYVLLWLAEKPAVNSLKPAIIRRKMRLRGILNWLLVFLSVL